MTYRQRSFTATRRNVVQNGLNSTLEITFPGSIAAFNNAEVALKSLVLYNSAFNINSGLYSNNTFQIKVPYSGGYSTVTITLPNGYFSYTAINQYVQSQLIAAGAYLITPTGYWYPFQLSSNSALYAAQIDLPVCYTSGAGIPSGWTYPPTGLWTGAGTLAAIGYTCQVMVPSGISSVLGFDVGSYPAALNQTSAYSATSNITPQIHPISSYFLTCSLVNNPMNAIPNILSSFTTQGTDIGQAIVIEPPEFAWLTIPSQNAQTVRFRILDQDFRPVQLQDPNICLELVIREKIE